MLPVLNRPLVDYIVADCVQAGIRDIIFVVLPRERQLRDYYARNQALEDYLTERKAQDKYELIASIHNQANFQFIEQPQDGRYGTAIPIELIQHLIGKSESFLVLMGDDFVYRQDGASEMADLITSYKNSGTNAAMSCSEVTRDGVGRYGVVDADNTSGQLLFKSLIEKPRQGQTDSCLINISNYVFDAQVFAYLSNIKPDPSRDEFYITDVLNQYVKANQTVVVHKTRGAYLDGGTVEGWLNANQVVAKAQGLL